MTWHQQDNNKKNHNPWKSKKNQKNNSTEDNNNNNDHKKKKFSLNDIFQKIIEIFSTLKKNKISNSIQKQKSSIDGRILIIIISLATIIIWIFSGFYTIKEGERGVVTRFGKFSHLVGPDLNWKPSFIDEVTAVNVESVRELAVSGTMLTADENIVHVEMNIQYKVINPERYLFSVINADESLRQATDSALHDVIGKYTMDRILTESRTAIRNDTQLELEKTIRPYNMGITLLDVNFQKAQPPKEVKAVFDDAIAARENEKQYIREAETYANEAQLRANGQAKRIFEEARAYRAQTILEAQGEVTQFSKVLQEYKIAPKIIRERLYIETMEKVLSHTQNILIDNNHNKNLIILPLTPISKINHTSLKNNNNNENHLLQIPPTSNNNSNPISISSSSEEDIMNQRREHAKRNNYQRLGE